MHSFHPGVSVKKSSASSNFTNIFKSTLNCKDMWRYRTEHVGSMEDTWPVFQMVRLDSQVLFWGDQLVVIKNCSNNSELVWFPSNVASFSLVIVGEVARHLNRVKHHILLTARQPSIHQFCKENRELCALRAKAFPIFGKDNGMRCPWLCTSDHGSIFPREFC